MNFVLGGTHHLEIRLPYTIFFAAVCKLQTPQLHLRASIHDNASLGCNLKHSMIFTVWPYTRNQVPHHCYQLPLEVIDPGFVYNSGTLKVDHCSSFRKCSEPTEESCFLAFSVQCVNRLRQLSGSGENPRQWRALVLTKTAASVALASKTHLECTAAVLPLKGLKVTALTTPAQYIPRGQGRVEDWQAISSTKTHSYTTLLIGCHKNATDRGKPSNFATRLRWNCETNSVHNPVATETLTN